MTQIKTDFHGLRYQRKSAEYLRNQRAICLQLFFRRL